MRFGGSKSLFFKLVLISIFLTSTAFADPRTLAIRLFTRLAGVPPTESQIATMESLIAAGNLAQAAQVATDKVSAKGFYNVTVKHFASSLSNRDQSPLRVLNDFMAMIVGVARDESDARELLFGDFMYVGNANKLALPALAVPVNSRLNNRQNNVHFDAMDNLDLVDLLERRVLSALASSTIVADQNQHPIGPYIEPGSPANDPNNTKMSDITGQQTAGLLTTRTWALEHLIAGTNRRGIEYAMLIFLCKPMVEMADGTMLDYHVRRDVDRAPQGSTAVFHTQCRTCHAGMDALGGAFSKYDYDETRQTLTFNRGGVSTKMNKLPIYFEGKVTTDESWENLFVQNQNLSLGWRGSVAGQGIKELGTMLSNSHQFSVCMSSRVFESVCYRKHVVPEEQSFIDGLANKFEGSGYNLRRLFEEAAILPICLGKE